MLKSNQNWKVHKVPGLLRALEKEVDVQLCDVRGSLYGQGNYRLSKDAAVSRCDYLVWCKKTEAEKDKMLKKLRKGRFRQKEAMVTSACGSLTVPSTPYSAKKPGQKTRPRNTKTQTMKKTAKGKKGKKADSAKKVPIHWS